VVYSFICRAEFEVLAAPFLARVAAPLTQVLDRSGVAVADLAAVELLGGGSRVLAVKAALSEALGGRNLDMYVPLMPFPQPSHPPQFCPSFSPLPLYPAYYLPKAPFDSALHSHALPSQWGVAKMRSNLSRQRQSDNNNGIFMGGGAPGQCLAVPHIHPNALKGCNLHIFIYSNVCNSLFP